MSEVVDAAQQGLAGKYQPYPEYKDSGVDWLGCIPRDWNKLALKHALEIAITDGPHETPVFIEEGVPFMSIDSIQNNKLVFDGCRYISIEDHKRYAKKCLPKRGDLLLGKAASVGKIAHVTTDNEFNVWSPLAVIRVDSCKHDSRFFYYSFQSSLMQYQCQIKSNSNTQANLGMGDISNLQFVYPTLPIQQTIAAFLDYETARIDRLIAQQQRLIELLKEKRQAVISHAVTKGLNPDVPMKDSGVEWLGQVPEHWASIRVKQVSTFITSGPRGWSDFISDNGGGIFLQSGDLNNELGLELDKAKRVTPPENTESVRTKLIDGDVVVCITGANTGRVAIVENLSRTTYINQHLSLIRPLTSKISSKYLGFSLASSGGRSFFDVVQYGLKEGLSLSNICEVPIALPPIDEQHQIVKHIESRNIYFDKLTSFAIHQVDLLRERRTALISAAVTGKIDLRGWEPPAEEAAA
ncbi:restriction endonuclease subunit S [Aeromonas sp. 603607]|uniref:restriction endonuclease subunit S n=1 Tax=Aeromonas TaxID=642 RepID=UPI003BA1FD8B